MCPPGFWRRYTLSLRILLGSLYQNAANAEGLCSRVRQWYKLPCPLGHMIQWSPRSLEYTGIDIDGPSPKDLVTECMLSITAT